MPGSGRGMSYDIDRARLTGLGGRALCPRQPRILPELMYVATAGAQSLTRLPRPMAWPH
jgi:hypothetical protein